MNQPKSSALQLSWAQRKTAHPITGSRWYSLRWLKTSSLGEIRGVYIIWKAKAGSDGRAVYVGQGDIANRLSAHQSRSDIKAHQSGGHRLFVTWAKVSESQMDGVERYLANTLKPLIGEKHPDVESIRVTLPRRAPPRGNP